MESTDRLERLLLAILLQLMKGESQGQKILRLNLAGFSNLEIADLLETTPAVVGQTIYASRKGAKQKKPKAKKG